MGSPLSPLITDIFMTSFEDSALSTVPFQPLCWYRKVDDVFTTTAHPNDIDHLLQYLNAQHPKIKFTMESETDHQLPFLNVSLQSTDHGCKSSVYREPTHRPVHPLDLLSSSQDQASHRSHPHQTKSICHPDALSHELQHLKDTFMSLNGYHVDFATKIINKTNTTENIPKPAPFLIKVTIQYTIP
ncbi:uncharacterized protein [Haliotis asinina]|uniref:uncharacterized protein n=1 Tax=Haliotis asinina TaxID=109174 RepID=UPI003531AD80